jgi:asparagine synthase (glutamine-hydrolysing)
MCGICGILTTGKSARHSEFAGVVKAMTTLMVRRGPDDEGYWSDGERCTFGFRRLSILDLSMFGHQPMLTQDGRYVIVFNGEVYNFPELRQQLLDKGVHFRSSGDTEVVLYALAHWGTEALTRFNGMFALAFYDTLKKSLLLARDHAGIKPLYYLLTPDLLVFASQYDQILAHPKSREFGISSKALGLYLRLGFIPAPFAMLENTHMLEAGTWLEITADGQRLGNFFEFPPYRKPILYGQEAFMAIDEAIAKAVKRHLISDVPVGTFLSGGIDSPLITAKAQALATSGVRAFTIGTNGDRFDESPDAIAYAQELGVDHIVEHVGPEAAMAMVDKVIDACGEPFGDYSIFPTMLISEIAHRHVKVMLSGDGGDELFWGYAGRFASVLKFSKDFRQPHWFRKLRWRINKFLPGAIDHFNLSWRNIGDWYKGKHAPLFEDWLKLIFIDLPEWPEEYAIFNYRGWELNQTAQWLRWNEFMSHLQMVLLKVDRASMFHSLEVRVPLLDREVMELATQIDWQSCLDVDRNLGKLPLRSALARHVNHQTNAKRGFDIPMGDWLRGPLRQLFEDEIILRREIVGLRLNQPKMWDMFQQHLSGKVDFSGGMWLLLSLSLWEKRHLKR